MAINGLGSFDIYSSYYSSNSLNRINENPLKQAEQTVSQKDTPKQVEDNLSSARKPLSLNLDVVKSRPTASLENISLSMKSSTEFEMKGRDSEIASLDMEKAVSDMQKDQALMQYTYFVGDSNIISQDEDGTVIQKLPQDVVR